MTEPLRVGIAFRISSELQDQIRAVDRRIELVDVSPLGGPGPIEAAEQAEICRRLADVEVLFGQNSIEPQYFDAAKHLRWFQAINAGVDNMHRRGLLGRNFSVTTSAGLAAVAIAEFSIGAMIMLARNFHVLLRDQLEQKWEFRFADTLQGKTLGVVGLGEIGRETARRARAFEMTVIATRRTVEPGSTDPDCDEILPYHDLHSVLERSDYVLLAVPLTPETNRMIGAEEFAHMKNSAFLVNVARGAVVDESAMIEALQSGRIAGAALDVFEQEPLPGDSPLWSMPNVIVTPHTAGSVKGYGHRAVQIFEANLRRYIAGEALRHKADPTLGY